MAFLPKTGPAPRTPAPLYGAFLASIPEMGYTEAITYLRKGEMPMDQAKTGRLIRALRQEQGLTQSQLAQRLGVSDKAVSKWERGGGSPDLSLLPLLASALAVDLESLLAGELAPQDTLGGTMKKTRFYVCPVCGNLIAAAGEAAVSCCGRPLQPLTPQAAGEEGLIVEASDGGLYVTSGHPMTKDHYISFVALLTGDSLTLRRTYPEWDLQLRLPASHGRLLWYCTRHGLFSRNI